MPRRTPSTMCAALSGFTLLAGSPGLFTLGGCEADPYRPQTDSILDYLRGPSPLFAAQMALDPYDPDRRYRGTLLLSTADFASEQLYMDLFRAYTTDDDSAVRSAAARAVAHHGTPDDVAYLIPLLKDDDPLVRREAARGLQRLHNPVAIAPLIAKLNIAPDEDGGTMAEEDTLVRAEAATALGQYATTSVVDALVASLDDPQLAVNRSSLRSLRTLTGQDLGFSRSEWTFWMQRQRGSPLVGQAVFIYPAYDRSLHWYEKIPFVPRPTMETPGVPAGFPLPDGS